MKLKYLSLLIVFALSLSAQTENTEKFLFCPNSPIVKDHEENIYRTVLIGSQCWMAENMRCKTSPSGKTWLSNPVYSSSHPLYSPYFATTTDERYGLLYSWAAAMDLGPKNNEKNTHNSKIQGICPNGWHLPDISEWETLFKTIGGNSLGGEMMKSTSQMWDPQIVNLEHFGCFEAPPAGAYTEDGYKYYGIHAYFWSSSSFNRHEAWCAILYDFKSEIYNYLNYKCYGLSVRCVKD